MRKAIFWILWPAFIVGGIAEVAFFTVFDPMDLRWFGQSADISRVTAYSFGFLLFWALAACSSTFTCFLQRRADEINRCPLSPSERPPGCPHREASDTCA